jgi:hypothetical protein
MFPKADTFNRFVGVQTPNQPMHTYRAGKIRIWKFDRLCPAETEKLKQLSSCITPVTPKRDVLQFIQTQLQKARNGRQVRKHAAVTATLHPARMCHAASWLY